MNEKKGSGEIDSMRKSSLIKYIRQNGLDPAGRSAAGLEVLYVGNLRRIAKGERE